MLVAAVALVAVSAAPQVTPKPLTLAYFIPKDRTPVADAPRRVLAVMSVVKDVYNGAVQGRGIYGQLVLPDQVHMVIGDQNAAYYNNAPTYDANEQWKRIVPEIRKKVGDPQKQVIVVFAETYDSGPAEFNWPGAIARGAYNNANGGLAIFSAHGLRDEFTAASPEELKALMFDKTPVPGRRTRGAGMNSPKGKFVENSLGAVAHELGHALGLPHDHRQDRIDLMGNGFRNIAWNFSHDAEEKVGFSEENARLLACSPYITIALNKNDKKPPKVEVTRNGRRIMVQATDETGLRALVVVDRTKESVIGGERLNGLSQTIRMTVPRENAVQVIVADQGGNQTRASG